ncbi:MAG: hypothetical protein IPI60_13615 [Saprospiraceae bacterium]|nr:hypothetical protein [Saprospiraceae bacterium]
MRNENNLITNWLDKNGNPEIEAFVEKNLAITEKSAFGLEAKAGAMCSLLMLWANHLWKYLNG